MVAQKIHDDTPLRNVDFAVAWGRVRLGVRRCCGAFTPSTRHSDRVERPRCSAQVLPGERPVPVERVNAMERVFLGALGFDLYVLEINMKLV